MDIRKLNEELRKVLKESQEIVNPQVIRDDVYEEVKKVFSKGLDLNDPEDAEILNDIMQYVYVETRKSDVQFNDGTDDDRLIVEVRAELNYEQMMNLADRLDKVIQKYDPQAYFEQVDSGIMDAYLSIKVNESLNEEDNCDWEKFGKNGEILRCGDYVAKIVPQVTGNNYIATLNIKYKKQPLNMQTFKDKEEAKKWLENKLPKNESLNESEFKVRVTMSDGQTKEYKAKDLNAAKRKFSDLCVRFNNCELLQDDKVLYNQNESLNEEDDRFKYMMLDRLRQDCLYYLEHPVEKHLWAGNVEDQIAKMKQFYNEVPEKPEWISIEEIEDLEKKMFEIKNKNIEESLKECNIKFAASPKAVEKLKKFIKPEYLELYKDMTDEEIDDMIRTENRLARRNRG